MRMRSRDPRPAATHRTAHARLPALTATDALRFRQPQVAARSTVALQAQGRAARSAVAAPIECNKKVTKKTQVVLTKPVQNLGSEGALVAVRVGYFRNFLLPQGFAKLADEGILAVIKAKREAEEAAARKARRGPRRRTC
jgi:hypothetical protein